MAIHRHKAHLPTHHKLVPPKTIYSRTIDGNGNVVRKKIGEFEGDHGRVIEGRLYSYHPKRGWRSRAERPEATYQGAGALVRKFLQVAFRKGIAI